jgi:hypothetical protein
MRHVLLSNLRGRHGWHDLPVSRGILSLAVVATVLLTPNAVAGQGNRTLVTYTVEFSLTVVNDPNCPSAGTDVLRGTIVGYEPRLPNEDNEYVGRLTRTTRMTTCGVRRDAAGLDHHCSINYVGDGFADVIFTIYEGQRGGYLQYLTDTTSWAPLLPPRPSGPEQSKVTGTCDPAELTQLENEYDQGQTAGSPNGQPLAVEDFPPLSLQPKFPVAFPGVPPESVWSLTLLDRKP